MQHKEREREGLLDGSETCYKVETEDGGTDKKTGGQAGGRGDEDAQIFIRSNQDGQD